MDKLLILVNHYHNESEVELFVLEVVRVAKIGSFDVELIVCDNSNTLSIGFGKDFDFVTVVSPGKNLGYLGGCEYGLRCWIEVHGSYPEWVAISNTDLHLPFDLLTVLSGHSENVGIVAPMIQTVDGIFQNPHIVTRPTKLRVIFYLTVHYNSYIGSAYMKLRKLTKRGFSKGFKNVKASSDKRQLVYAPHGSFFFVSKAFFIKGGRMDGFEFLYSEEWYVAEQLVRLGLECVCDYSQVIIHDEHSVTQKLSDRDRSKYTFQSSLSIFKKYYLGKPFST